MKAFHVLTGKTSNVADGTRPRSRKVEEYSKVVNSLLG